MEKLIVTVIREETGENVWGPFECEGAAILTHEGDEKGNVSMYGMDMQHLMWLVLNDKHMLAAAKLAVEFLRWRKSPRGILALAKAKKTRRHTNETQKTQ